jgi:hypothetical protein
MIRNVYIYLYGYMDAMIRFPVATFHSWINVLKRISNMSKVVKTTLADFCTQILSPFPPLPDDRPATEPSDDASAPVPKVAVTSSTVPPGNVTTLTDPSRHILGPVQLTLNKSYFWRPGQTLRVYFMNGTSTLQAKVFKYARQWDALCNIKFFKWPRANLSDIRVRFGTNGNNSAVGTSCKDYRINEPTMNLQLADDTDDETVSRMTLHEFGHAIGAVHEHESPGVSIPWNLDAVYRYYQATDHWDKDTVDRNVLHQFSEEDVEFSVFDEDSIMIYPIPAELTIGGFTTPYTTALSDGDEKFIKLMYGWQRRDKGFFNTLEKGNFVSQQQRTKKIEFHPPYAEPPIVATVLTGFDIGFNTAVRIVCGYSEVHEQSMEANIQSWTTTFLNWAGMAWAEFEKNDPDFQTGSFRSTDVRPWTDPRTEDTKVIEFSKHYSSPPMVVCFINCIDIDIQSRVTIRVWADEITTTTFKAHIACDAGTTMSDGGLTWIAYPSNKIGVCSDTIKDLQKGTVAYKFLDGTFVKPPSILQGLNAVHIGPNNKHGTRVNSSTDKITKTGFEASCNVWADTEADGLCISFIAFGDFN